MKMDLYGSEMGTAKGKGSGLDEVTAGIPSVGHRLRHSPGADMQLQGRASRAGQGRSEVAPEGLP